MMKFFNAFFDKMRQIRNFFLKRVVLSYFVVFLCLFGSWLILVVSGLLSPARQVYPASNLATEQTFENGTGTVELKKQIYSKKDQMLLLNFETKAQSNNTPINPKNLTWKIYSKDRDSRVTMEVIPILNNKITVLVKDVPQNFDALAISIINHGSTENNISVDLTESSSSAVASSKSSDEAKDYVQFLITTRGKKLKYKTLGQLDRTELASSEVDKEIKFQENQKANLQKAITNLRTLISDSKSKIRELEKEEIYLTSDQKENNLSQIEQLEQDIDNYQQDISKARENIGKIDARIKMLKKKKSAIKSGTFEFSEPIKVVHTK